jgi:lysyl-tRNA synthetase class 2
MSRPITIRQMLEFRAAVRARLRGVFDGLGFIEVDTPVLSTEVLPEAQIDPIVVELDGRSRYLQTSPEALMKRLLAKGSGPIYQFARSFRAGERGDRHDVEFVLLEWYAPDTGLDEAAVLLDRLCAAAIGTDGIDRIGCREAFLEFAGIDPFQARIDEWRAAGGRQGVRPPEGCGDSVELWFELLLGELVSPRLGQKRPCMLEAWPASQAAFARLDPADPRVARRFELFVAGVELANGWEEETSRDVLRERIAAANRTRLADGRNSLPLPQRLIEAHGETMPEGVGAALGFDRLVMLAAGASSIDAVRGFSSRDA